MTSVAPRLKALRLTARPALSLRSAAEKLGLGHSSYGFYESANSYKKPFLPLELARKIAVVFAEHGIDPSDVMALAGLTGTEAEPEAREIQDAKPKRHWVHLPVCLPSEAALAAMFETLLALIPEDATRAEAARILAQRLPTGFAAIGPAVYEEDSDEEPAHAAPPRERATDRPDSPRL